MSSTWERIWAKSGEVHKIPSPIIDFNYFPSVLILDHYLVMSRHLRIDSSGWLLVGGLYHVIFGPLMFAFINFFFYF